MKTTRTVGHRRALAKIRRLQAARCPDCGRDAAGRRERLNQIRYWAAETWLSVIDQSDDTAKRRVVEEAMVEAIDAVERAYRQAIAHVIPDEWTRNEIIRSAVSSDTFAQTTTDGREQRTPGVYTDVAGFENKAVGRGE